MRELPRNRPSAVVTLQSGGWTSRTCVTRRRKRGLRKLRLRWSRLRAIRGARAGELALPRETRTCARCGSSLLRCSRKVRRTERTSHGSRHGRRQGSRPLRLCPRRARRRVSKGRPSVLSTGLWAAGFCWNPRRRTLRRRRARLRGVQRGPLPPRGSLLSLELGNRRGLGVPPLVDSMEALGWQRPLPRGAALT